MDVDMTERVTLWVVGGRRTKWVSRSTFLDVRVDGLGFDLLVGLLVGWIASWLHVCLLGWQIG